MADITITCPKCGRNVTVSEYVGGGTTECPACGETVHMPSSEKKSGLSLKRRDTHTTLAAPMGDEADGESAEGLERLAAESNPEMEKVSAALRNVHKTRNKIIGPKTWIGWGVCLLISGMFYWLMSTSAKDKTLLDEYVIMRNIYMAVVMLLVYVIAFQDGYIQGLLCLLVPPYMIYYAFVRLERPLITGMVIALAFTLTAELRFHREQSVLRYVQVTMQDFVTGGSGIIDDLSAEPDFY